MPEFMLLVRNQADHQASWKPERHLAFVKQCETYIGELKQGDKLIAAQPLVKAGVVVKGSKAAWQETPLDRNGKIQVGYYHIRAADTAEAIAMAKGNPEFEFSTSAEVEVRMIKTHEAETGFIYPK